MVKFWKISSLDRNEEAPKMVFEEYGDNGATGRSMTFIKHDGYLSVTQNPDERERYNEGLKNVDFLDSNNPEEVARFNRVTGYIFTNHNLAERSISDIMQSFYWGTPNPNGRVWFSDQNRVLFTDKIVDFFRDPAHFVAPNVNMGGRSRRRNYRKSRKAKKSRRSKKSRKSRKSRKY